ncbi:MAG: PadR family transcriptional regulator [Acidimicrobiales bacterium]|nr:PadR family transcriptional regulator [Acidimicrobiales bacterium]
MSVRMGLLALLEEGPAHGYHLKGAFEARTGGVWTVNVGQVYTTLDRLHADGLVQPVTDEATGADQGSRDRRRWELTPAGKGALDDWFDEGPATASPPRDELLVKVLLAFGRSPSEALAVIDRQRVELYRQTQAHRRSRTRAANQQPDPTADPRVAALARLTADLMAEAISARHEADLRWLDHCESVLISNPEGRNQ